MMNSQMMEADRFTAPKNRLFGSKSDTMIYFILFCMIEAVFLNSSLQIIVGPLLAFLFSYLYLFKKDTLLVTLFIMIANDSLGTVFWGKISFQYVLIVLVVCKVLSQKTIQLRTILLFLLATAMILQPYFTNVVPFKNTIITVFYVIALLLEYETKDKDAFFERMKVSISLIVGLISIHAILTGGVVFSEDIVNSNTIEGMRRGILGVGIGDPNFSCLLLCTGIICVLNAQSFNRIFKVIIFAVCTGAMLVTLSTAGLIAYILVLLLNIVVQSGFSKIVKQLSIVVIVIVLVSQIYFSLPSQYRIEYIDTYVERMEMKADYLSEGDMASATTNRSDIAEQYWNYIMGEQSFLGKMFGGNSVLLLRHVPHNTYIDFIVQFGFIGAIFLILFIIKRFIGTCFAPKDMNRKIQLILKVLYMVFIFSISVYSESTFALLFVFLFVF